jgi:carbamoyl-phosphate synthase large subunit
VLIEESALGWKEFELEVMRDLADNCIIVCSIENFDAMGVHTGDSITVAPAQTLTDREYQMMRDAALGCLREIGVDTGGSNVQFAINPVNGRMVIIEMNPRVSRSSALASKATGFPIAKIAAKLAVGYRLDEISNDITRKTPACFEPTIDYVVAKIPKWAFEKFPGADPTLGTQMKSVGEVMAIGRTFKQAFWKGMRSLETGKAFGSEKFDPALVPQKLITPTPDRLGYIRFAMANGYSVEDIQEMTSIDPWFLRQMKEVVDFEGELRATTIEAASAELLRRAKRYGISDVQLAKTWGVDQQAVRTRRKELGVAAVFSRVDTCAAEFESFTPYLYSNYESACEADPSTNKKVVILGSGPNRIGQGIEFDYCCCHASFALQEMGVESIMVNCNPETVSTDYDTSDRLYFEPLTLENVLNICDTEKPDGVIVQFGGQTPLTLALPLERLGVPIIGTDPKNIDLAEDRKLFGKLLDDLAIPCPRQRHRHQRRRGLCGGAAPRLPGAGAAQLRAGRARHGDRLRRGDGAPVHARSRHLLAGPPGAGRPLPRRRDGSGRGRARRLRTATSSSPASWSTSRRPASIRAIAPACCRRNRCPRRTSAPSRITPCAWPGRST